jgi:hypothetical protein
VKSGSFGGFSRVCWFFDGLNFDSPRKESLDVIRLTFACLYTF